MSKMTDRIVANFRRLPRQEQENMRRLRADPEVAQYAAVLRKVLPREVLDGLPSLRAPARAPRRVRSLLE